MKKRICIIRSNPVRPDSRVEKEIDALVSAGYQVYVLCWDREADYKIKVESGLPNVIFVRLGYKASYGEGVKNLGAFIKFQIGIVKWLICNRKDYDVIHACDFDTAFTSYRVSRLVKKKFVFDIFDFIYGEPVNLFQKFIRKEQFHLINRADATIICTEKRLKQIEGTTPKHLCVIHNTPPKIINEVNKCEERINEKVKVVYVGILQDFRLLLEMGHYFQEHKEYELHIGGFGKYENYFAELANKNANIYYYGKLQYQQTLELEKNCDIMTAIYDPKIENHRYAAPNKFYESLMLGKPVIMVKGTGMSEEIEANGIGAVIEYSEEGFGNGLQQLCAEKENWSEISEKMMRLYREKYDWNMMKERLIKLYQTII